MLLEMEADKPYFKTLCQFLKTEYSKAKQVFPAREKILRALQLVDYADVRIVILGQDPYHGPEQAVGLCFAVPNQLQPKPPSLINIFQELKSDVGLAWNRSDSELTGWAAQGVLLLNTVLTVQNGQPLSHRNKGWEIFTDRIISLLSEREEPLIFILWGSAAQSKIPMIDHRHFILKAPHPSPLSAHRGFLGCKHFSKANQILKEKLKRAEIDWAKINA